MGSVVRPAHEAEKAVGKQAPQSGRRRQAALRPQGGARGAPVPGI